MTEIQVGLDNPSLETDDTDSVFTEVALRNADLDLQLSEMDAENLKDLDLKPAEGFVLSVEPLSPTGWYICFNQSVKS